MTLPGIIAARLERVEPVADFSILEMAAPERVGLTMEDQIGTQWCWAAVAASFASHRGMGTFEQCRLAKDLLPQHSNENDHDCCNVRPPLEECNQRAALATALDRVGFMTPLPVGSLLFSEVKPAVLAKSLIACVIFFPSTATNHFVQLDGYDEATKQYIINDPQRHQVTLSFDDLLSNYNNEGGTWQQTIMIP